MNLMDLFIKISVDDQASDKIDTLSTNLKNGLASAAKVATGAITAGGTALAALGKIGFDYNQQMETYTTNFEVMLGDSEAAAQKIEELKEFAAKTPFEMGGLASATQTLLSFGIEADNTTNIMRMLGDVSLGDAQKFDSLALVFGQVSSQGKLTGQDLLQMINAGFNPLQTISEETGESMASLKERMSAGGITIEDVTQAFTWATEEGGKFYQGMEKGSQTTAGLASTLQDVANSKAGEFFSGISEKIKEMLPDVISFVESIDVEKVTKSVENLLQTFQQLLPVIVGVTAATVAYKAAVAISGIIDAVTKATQGLSVAQALLNAVMNANPFVLIVTLITGVVTALLTLWNTNEGFRDAVTNIWEGIKKAFSTAWDFIKNIFGKVGEFFSGVWDSIKGAFADVGGWFSKKFKEGQENSKKAWENAKKIFGDVWNNIKSAFSDVGNWFKSTFEKGQENSKKAWDNAKETFGKVWDNVKSAFSTVGDWFSETFKNGQESAAKAWDNAKDVFGGIWDKIKEVFSKGAEIGSDIVQGIKEGISGAWHSFTDWVGGLFDGLVNGVKDLLGIASPSKVFASIGGYMAEGLEEGWDDKFSSVRKNINKSIRFNSPVVSTKSNNMYNGVNGIGNSRHGVSIVQNIYSQAKTAADLMQEAIYQQERAVLLGV